MEWSPNFLNDWRGLVPKLEIFVCFVSLFFLMLKKNMVPEFLYGWGDNPLLFSHGG